MSLMTKAMPDMMQAMPAIMAKVQAATAHLPVPEPREEKSGKKKRD